MDKFSGFFEMLIKDRTYSAWSKENTFETRLLELKEEVNEIEIALKNNDMQNFKEELGDTLWDLMYLVVIAQEKGIFNMEEVLDGSISKLKRRKEWIFKEDEPELKSKEEEIQIWNEVKKKEKESGLR